MQKGAQGTSVVLAGDGSGGGLAFSVTLAIRNAGLPLPAAIVAMSPWADLSLSGWSVLQDFPPIMVHAGSLEMLRDDASRLGDRAAEAGTRVSVEIYDGMQHVFQANPYVPEARVSLARLGQFIKTRSSATVRADEAKAV